MMMMMTNTDSRIGGAEDKERDMNKVALLGRFTKDPDVRYSAGEKQTAIARFTLAVDRRFNRDEQSADFISCVAFGKTAEVIEKYMKKGTKVSVVGRIQTGSYTNKDGNKVYTTDVIVEEIEFAESKGSSSNAEAPKKTDDGFMNIPDGEDEALPFN